MERGWKGNCRNASARGLTAVRRQPRPGHHSVTPAAPLDTWSAEEADSPRNERKWEGRTEVPLVVRCPMSIHNKAEPKRNKCETLGINAPEPWESSSQLRDLKSHLLRRRLRRSRCRTR